MAMLARIVSGSSRIQGLLHDSAARRAAQFQQLAPLAAQRRIFRELLQQGAETVFGRDYAFGRVAHRSFEAAYDHFRFHVPIRSYQQFWTDYFASHCRDGIPRLDNLTWPGRIRLFCETSGTTAPTKYIPFSEQMFAENRRAGLDLISCYLAARPNSGVLGGRILYMSGSTALTRYGDNVCSGDMSAITLRFRPWYLAPLVEPSADIAALPWDAKLEAMAHLLLRDPGIRAISGVPPWILLLLKRCRELSAGGPLRQLLPQLRLIIHGGTSMKPYQAEFDQMFGGAPPDYVEVLPSSEAFMGFQCAGDPAMQLTPYYGAFYEFVRFEDLDDSGRPAPYAPTVPLEEVELGQRYAVILTTCSGLWRYHIGDTIRFTGQSPHFIEFTGRDRFLDKLEEKVTQEEVERVVAELKRVEGVRVGEFIVGTDIPGRRHVWVLSGSGMAGDGSDRLDLRIDERLSELNADYAAFRRQGRIGLPRVVVTGESAIYEWSRQVRGKLGGQSKIPHIDPSPDASMVPELLAWLKRVGPTGVPPCGRH